MDCEKFEASMLDELYGELDELTLAASKRHVGGCARCSALMAGLRATRKVVTLPVLAPSEGFESRLLSAVQAAEAETRPKVTFARVISWAGGWAMRPQTAMAAVFLLLLGTSSVLLSRKAPRSAMSSASSFTVTENGVPAPVSAASAAPTSPDVPVDPRAAAAAHGVAPPPMAQAAAAPASTLPAGPAKSMAGMENVPAEPSFDQSQLANQAGGGKFATAPKARPARMAPNGSSVFDDTPGSLGSLGRGGDLKGSPETQFTPPPPAPAPLEAAKDEVAREEDRRADGERAVASFDQLAAAGDWPGALTAARGVRDGTAGCGAAVQRFDQVANSAPPGSKVGYDAMYDAANCYKQLGQTEAARSRYSRLSTVPAYQARAQLAINALSYMASARKSMAKAAAIAPATPPAAAAPAATPAASTSVQTQQK